MYGTVGAAFTAFWQMLAQSRPAATPAIRDGDGEQQQEKGVEEEAEEAKEKTKKTGVEWGIFRVPTVKATMLFYMTCEWPDRGIPGLDPSPFSRDFLLHSDAHLNFSIELLAPTYFIEKLGCSPTTTGALLAAVASINLPGTLVTGAIEQVNFARQIC